MAMCAVVHESSCQVTWRRTYGGFGSEDAANVRQTSDGGYIIAGSTGSLGNGSGDVYVVRVDEFGEPIWSRTYGGIGVEKGVACREIQDGFIIAGSTSLGQHGGYDMLLIRTDQLGEPIWVRNFGTADWDLCNALAVVDDGLLLGGTSYSLEFPYGAAYIVKTDLDGDTLWTVTIGGALKTSCNGLSETADLGFVLCGAAATASGFDDGFIAKCDVDGNLEWTAIVGGDSLDYLTSIIETSGGDFVAIGGTRSFSAAQQIYLLNVGDTGQLIWERLIGNASDAGGTEVRLNPAGGFVFTGYNTLNLGNRDMIFTVTDADGWFEYGFNYGNGNPADGYSVDPTQDGGYVVAGWTENYGPGLRSMYVVKTDTVGQTSSLDVEVYFDPVSVAGIRREEVIRIYPNPVVHAGEIQVVGINPNQRVRGTAYDLTGRLVRTWSQEDVLRPLSIQGLASGSYEVMLSSELGVLHNTHLIVQ